MPAVKAHLFDSPVPVIEGSTVTAICGATVANTKFVLMWDADEIGHMYIHLPGFCRKCCDLKFDYRYIYGILNGQELTHGEG